MLEKNRYAIAQADLPSIRPGSGLPVFQRPEWVDVPCGKDYQTTAFFIADRIFVTRPKGYPRHPGIDTALNFTRRLTDTYIPKDQTYIQIEDYKELIGVSLEARRHFISDMIKRSRIQALIFCNVEPVFKLIYKLAERIPFVQKKVYLVDDYADALKLAFKLLDKNSLPPLDHAPFFFKEAKMSEVPPTFLPRRDDNIQQQVDDLLVFLTRINWWATDEIFSDEQRLDPNHPFYPIYEAAIQIKGELNELFQAHTEAIRALRERENELKIKAIKLEEVNIALKVLLQRKDEIKEEIEKNVVANFNELVLPSLVKLKSSLKDQTLVTEVEKLSANLDAILSPFARKLTSKYFKLTATEIKVANLIKHGGRTKDIAESLNLSYKTIETHRVNIRKKLGLTNKKANLQTYLQSL